MAVIEPVQPDS